MLFNFFLKSFVRVGTLTVIDHRGNSHVFSATPTPAITLRLHNKAIERRLAFAPSFALGEGYTDGDLSIENGDIYDFLIFCGRNLQKQDASWLTKLSENLATIGSYFHWKNPISRAQQNVAHHYDLSENLYRLFLDKDMQYSCAYFKSLDDDLDTAQENKKRHIAAKLRLEPGQKVLDIGSGWGGLAITLARDWDVDVTGLTLSVEQHRVATERAKAAGVEDRVRFYLRDYRHETGRYDRIVSVGMFEHVGVKHYTEFFNQVHTLLKDDGLALLHSIGISTGPTRPNAWLYKYIFPGGYCPALSETLAPLEPSRLYVTDIEILHHHYAETLRHWRERFLAHKEEVLAQWGERFFRMWDFYLSSCRAAFLTRGFMIFQIQMMKNVEHSPLTRDYIAEKESQESAQVKRVKRTGTR